MMIKFIGTFSSHVRLYFLPPLSDESDWILFLGQQRRLIIIFLLDPSLRLNQTISFLIIGTDFPFFALELNKHLEPSDIEAKKV